MEWNIKWDYDFVMYIRNGRRFLCVSNARWTPFDSSQKSTDTLCADLSFDSILIDTMRWQPAS
ncbi:hypothetical protein BDD12DRAFT_842240 [Trichophaea hybrida]|nr:hypothetical protein BDD12DRAFT_842240 [Trichophaea hybrida]